MRTVFCVTVKNRTAHLALTLPPNLAGNPRSTFVILDYGSQEDLSPVITPLASDRLHVYRYECRGPFAMAHAKNLAHRLGMLHKADLLVNVDADNYLHEGFEDFLDANFKPDAFFWAGEITGSDAKVSSPLRGTNGRIAITPGAFIKTGGYDEKYKTWSGDDRNFNWRLRYVGYKGLPIDRKYLEAIAHDDEIRFRDYPQAFDKKVWLYKEAPYDMGIANFGAVGVGEVVAPDGGRIQIDPIPTRIFGVGLHKTSLTSLAKALENLGYDSVRWPAGTWVQAVWDEMRKYGKSQTLEGVYAVSDLPISLLYKELDRAYPRSKFILTVRDEVDWLRSARDHFSDRNPLHKWWDEISHELHEVLYGRKDFDTSAMLSRYRRHNAEVREYFKNRPNDLLVMDMDAGAGWAELCKFLGQPVPAALYPREYVTVR
ncbi:MAG: sulfotransferase family protein [Candidatus Binataceae bacterium]